MSDPRSALAARLAEIRARARNYSHMVETGENCRLLADVVEELANALERIERGPCACGSVTACVEIARAALASAAARLGTQGRTSTKEPGCL